MFVIYRAFYKVAAYQIYVFPMQYHVYHRELPFIMIFPHSNSHTAIEHKQLRVNLKKLKAFRNSLVSLKILFVR